MFVYLENTPIPITTKLHGFIAPAGRLAATVWITTLPCDTGRAFPPLSLQQLLLNKNNPRKEAASPKGLLKTWFPSSLNVEQADNQNRKYFKQRQLQNLCAFILFACWGK